MKSLTLIRSNRKGIKILPVFNRGIIILDSAVSIS